MKELNKGNYKAITLIETLMYIALTAMMLGPIVMSYGNFLTMKTRASVREEVNNQATFIIHKINYALRNAESISQPTAQNNSTSITYVNSRTGQTETLELNGSTLRISAPGNNRNISNTKVAVTNFNVVNGGATGTAPVISYSFTLSTNGGSIDFTYSNDFRSAVSLKTFSETP